MKNITVTLGTIWGVLILSGCPIWIEPELVEPPCDGECSRECYLNENCPLGYFCNDGNCSYGGVCDDDWGCPVGFSCDEFLQTCIPNPCVENGECPQGYCDIEENDVEGRCVETGDCSHDFDCVRYGPGLVCDTERHVCILDEGPCPDGECGCVSNEECESSQLCINSRCRDINSVCIFDFECEFGSCLNNECHASCSNSAPDCPVGQECIDQVCMEMTVGADNCVYDEDCNEQGAQCINATCHSACEEHIECGAGETCRFGICRAQTAPEHFCTKDDGQCVDEKECIRGICRMPCASTINCAQENGMTKCFNSFCHFPSELESNCSTSIDCGPEGLCIDGSCL